MGAVERDKGSGKPHPAVAAVLVAVVLAILLAFPVALYANAMALADGYRASRGEAGTPGTVTVVGEYDAKREQVCTGAFVPDGGGPEVEVRVEVPGRCAVGQVVEAHLMEGRASVFIGYDEPRAWAAGSNDWTQYIVLVVLFGLLSLPAALVAVMAVKALVKGVGKLVKRPAGPPTY
ncbi:hypothetical protein [Glycomyces harbinensis]|uniref:DUF3592 domain-containing protein n=1 Tax=Glycomyces harbinensis TaxID=58114 RepID=A0A1G6QSL6_9ACTN|nr:hypothetical protein [Glycomyces harbinensis]SDC95291.1 hypothetical protein SAMN05216270_10183 [Glycomyces harbinensis]